MVYTSPPPTAEPLLKEKPLGWVHFSACTKRCVPPHPLRSAQHLPPSGGRLLLSCISSCLTNLTNDRTQPRLIPASNHAPWQRTAQLDAGLAKPDRRGKAGSERRKACFHPGGSGFHLPRGAGGQSHSQFYSSSFHVTYRFFVTFFTEESNVPLRSLRPPASLLFAIKKAKLLLRRNIAIRVSLFHPEAGLAAVH